MANLIQSFLENFAFSIFVLAWVFILLTHKSSALPSYENCFRWMMLLPLGINNLYYFVMHVFFGDITAAAIGWLNSPFQYEVGIANLGMGLIAVMAFKASFDFRKAAVITNVCWLWGAAIGHVYEMLVKGSFVPGNSGSWFWVDVFVPLILIFCFMKMRKPALFN